MASTTADHVEMEVAAYDVHARMQYAGSSLAEAAHGVIWDTLERSVPGSGGLVAVDAEGNVAFTFNTAGMYRGWIDERGRAEVAIYLDD